MLSIARSQQIFWGLLVAVAGNSGPARADSAQGRFYEAFYVERSQSDFATAAKLYQEVVSDRRADPELRARASARLVASQEELASSDFAKLMPPEAFVYVELRRPGDRITRLLEKLGLLADPGRLPEEGAKRLAISPALIQEVLGIGGIAAAVTGFDPFKQVPSGVVVFHPGNLEVVRGLIETGLPIAGTNVEPIGGFPTYEIEGKVVITLTSRLVVAGSQRAQIEGVLRRLSGKETRSLATSAAMGAVMGDRDDALLLFFVNAKPLLPLVQGVMAATGSGQELKVAQAVLDLDSLQSLSGRIDLGEDGINLDVGLRLDEGHHNLIYNLLRAPAFNHEALKSIPQGAAGFLVGALNEATSRYGSAPASTTGTRPVVTALDFGREIFGNITSLAIFALPPDGSGSEGGPPIPDIGVAITVNDPAKSEALWTQMLGIASLATGAAGIEGTPVDIEGTAVRTYRFPNGPTIHFAAMGDDMLIASTRSAMARSIRAKRSGTSVLEDAAFAKTLSRLSKDTTKAVVVHAGRCAEIARQFMSPGDIKEIGPILNVLSDTAASFVVEHSGELFRLSLGVSGVPDVGDIVAELIAKEQRKGDRRARVKRAIRSENWNEAIAAIDAQLADHPDSVKLLRKKFDILAVWMQDPDAATACAKAIFDETRDNARALNNFAWALLTNDKYGHSYNDLALKLSKRSNDITDHENWMFLDTLALASFETGDAASALKLEKKAIELCEGQGIDDLKKALARFEAGLDQH